MSSLENKNIIVTGASGGIGNAIIKKLSEAGANILASGTRIEKLEELKKNFEGIKILKFDISQSDKIEKFIPPKKGKPHILRIIRELISFQPQNKKTNISEALKYFSNVMKKRSICFLMSDFKDENFEKPLRIANKKHDMISVKINDLREKELPQVGLIQLKDAETDELKWVDTNSDSVRSDYAKHFNESNEKINEILYENPYLFTDKYNLQNDNNIFIHNINFINSLLGVNTSQIQDVACWVGVYIKGRRGK